MFSGAEKEFNTIKALAGIGLLSGVAYSLYNKKSFSTIIGYGLTGALIGTGLAIGGLTIRSFKK